MVKPWHLPSKNLFALCSAEIHHLPALRSIGMGPVYPETVPTAAAARSFGGVKSFREEVKPIPPSVFSVAFSAQHC